MVYAIKMSHAKQMLVDLVNRDNNLELHADQVIFKDVANNGDPLIKRNTYALMEAVPGKGCKNSTPLYYHRIDLSVLFLNVNANVPLPQPHEDGGTVAQNLVLMALATVQQEFYTITGNAVVPVVSH